MSSGVCRATGNWGQGGVGYSAKGTILVKCCRTDCPQGIVQGETNAVIVLGKCPLVNTQKELFYGVVVLYICVCVCVCRVCII